MESPGVRVVQLIVDVRIQSEEDEMVILQAVEAAIGGHIMSGITLMDVSNFYQEK